MKLWSGDKITQIVGCIFILYLSFETTAVLEPDLLDFK